MVQIGIFTYKKPAIIIKKLNSNPENMQRITRIINATYSYTVKTIQELEKYGIIKTELMGRQRLCSLTEKGQRVKELLIKLDQELI